MVPTALRGDDEELSLAVRSPRVLYVSPNGVGSPLVRSQVLPYLRGLAEDGVDAELVTFERGDPYPEGEFPKERWHPLRPRPGRGLIAKLMDIVSGIALVASLAVRSRRDLFHARSYLPAAIVAVPAFFLRRPFIFDMRGFLPDEYLDAGSWTARDVRYRALRAAERILLWRAAEVVVLTERAADVLRIEPRYRSALGDTPVTVIPCTVDLEQFRPATERRGAPTLVYSGSLGMWYLLDEMLAVYAYAREQIPDLRFLILNRGEHELVNAALARAGAASGGVELRAVPPGEMPGALAGCHVGIALIKPTPSKRGSSPVKVAEYLACGLPVVVNAGIGDTDRLVERYRAGHVISVLEEPELRAAGLAVAALLGDNEARSSARRLAEAEYDVHMGIVRYADVYGRALSRS